MSVTRFIMRWGLISGLALGGMTLLVGPDRMAAGLTQVRCTAQDMIGTYVEDPVALRRQLEQLSEKYPDQIAEVRGEIAEVEHQIGQFNRDIEVAQRVVALTTTDLNELKDQVARAEGARIEHPGRAVHLSRNGSRLNIDQALSEAKRINTVRLAYKDRVAQDQQQLAFLNEQRGRLSEILDKLEDEFGSMQAQLWSLDREIEAIERNERLIELTEEQQATLRSYERYGNVGNFSQLQGRLAEIREQQEARLEVLSSGMRQDDYETRALMDLDTDVEVDSIHDFFDQMDVEDTDDADDATGTVAGSVAWSGPIVID